MNSLKLNSDLYLLPYYYMGKINPNLSDDEIEICEQALRKLEIQSGMDRLSDNYKKTKLHLGKMVLYSVVVNKSKEPIFVSGAQQVGAESVRLFSRYFVFPKFRTRADQSSLFDKIDDFKLLEVELDETSEQFPFVFWTRDRGTAFFQRLKMKRMDIFSDWKVKKGKVEIIYKDNWQGVFYLNRSSRPDEFFLEVELPPKC